MIIKSIKRIFYPEKVIRYQSPLEKHEIEAVIKDVLLWNENFCQIYPKNYYTFRDFEGYKRNSVFYTRRILKQGMNSFIPMTEIQVNSYSKGSAVELTFKMQIQIVNIYGKY